MMCHLKSAVALFLNICKLYVSKEGDSAHKRNPALGLRSIGMSFFEDFMRMAVLFLVVLAIVVARIIGVA